MNLSDYEISAVKDETRYGVRLEVHCKRCRPGYPILRGAVIRGAAGWPSADLATLVAAANLHALDNHERLATS